MADEKIHPSELLEFSTVTSTLKSHVEHVAGKNQEPGLPAASYGDQKGSGPTTVPLDSDLYRGLSLSGHDIPRIGSDALAATQSEHRMTFKQGFLLYPKAICWSAMISLAIIMEGYDTALISSFYAFPEFQRSYGVPSGSGGYQITTKWQSALNNGSVAGSIIGLFANGIITEIFGYRRTMIASLIALSGFIFLSFFAFNINTLLASQILCGVPWGIFSTLTTTYAAEVMPLNLRGYLTANVNLCWLIGQITAQGTLRGLLDMKTQWSYRIPFGLQWGWIVIILVGAILAPESPWWLLRHGRIEETKAALLRLTRHGRGFNVDNTVAMMEHTNTVERKLNGGRDTNYWSYRECFRGPNLRRTEIACMIFMTQNLSGLPVISFAAYLYSQIGFDQKQSFDLTIGMHALAILGGLLSLVLMKSFGRRTLYLAGLVLQFLILVAAGSIACLRETPTTLWAGAAMIILFIFVFDITLGPLTYCLVAEIPSTRLRVKTVVLARVSYNLTSMVTNVLQQHMLNPLAWNWHGKSCFFWAGSCLCCLIYCYFRLPETYGLTYHELDLLFEKRAPAMQFATLQKKLAETGYFSFYNGRPEEANWG